MIQLPSAARLISGFLALVTVAACSGGTDRAASRISDTTVSTTMAKAAVPPAFTTTHDTLRDSTRDDTRASARAPEGGTERAASQAFTVTPAGIGPVHAGMTVAEAAAAFGAAVPDTSKLNAECGYARLAGAPARTRYMFVHGRLARVDIDTSSVATSLGVRIGDAESVVQQKYPGQITIKPHKYVAGGRYMEVTPSARADSALRLVFETDGKRVTQYHAGLLPSVEWVEGCA